MEGERKKNKIMQLLEGAIISLTAGTHNEKKMSTTFSLWYCTMYLS